MHFQNFSKEELGNWDIGKFDVGLAWVPLFSYESETET